MQRWSVEVCLAVVTEDRTVESARAAVNAALAKLSGVEVLVIYTPMPVTEQCCRILRGELPNGRQASSAPAERRDS